MCIVECSIIRSLRRGEGSRLRPPRAARRRSICNRIVQVTPVLLQHLAHTLLKSLVVDDKQATCDGTSFRCIGVVQQGLTYWSVEGPAARAPARPNRTGTRCSGPPPSPSRPLRSSAARRPPATSTQ